MVASVLINFGKFIAKSVLASAIICTVSLSIMTKRFPPDLTQIKSTYAIIRNLQSLSHQKPVAVVAGQNSVPDSAPDSLAAARTDDDEIQDLIQQRQNVLAPLADISKPLIEQNPIQEKVVSCEFQETQIQQLKNKIDELDKQNLTLNQKILELKYSKQ